MFIHFAFGQLGKQGKIKEQTDSVIGTILTQKRLLARNCTEFLPSFPQKRSRRVPTKQIEKVTKSDDGKDVVWFAEIDLRKTYESKEIVYLPQDVPMICFIKISFSQLKASPHCNEYGKFGLVLSNQFLESQSMKSVSYYTEESLWSDREIVDWNNACEQIDQTRQQSMQRHIVAYRKPATYFPSFAELTTIEISKTIEQTGSESYRYAVDSYKYDRYGIGYDFRNEHEHRIVFQEDGEYLRFNEGDVFMIVVPDLESKNQVITYLKSEWKRVPSVEVFPN